MILLPLIPLVILTKNKALMDQFVNRRINTLMAIAFVGIILAFNTYLIINASSSSQL